MNLLVGINQFLRLYLDTIRQLGRGRIWLVLVTYFGLQWLLLYAHYVHLQPSFYALMSNWAALFGSDLATAFSHYPQHFLLMGHFFGWAKLGIGLILEGVVLGLVARMFHQCFTGSVGGRSAVKAWFDLILVWAVISGLMLLAGMYLPGWLDSLLNSPRRLLAFQLGFLPLIQTLIMALLFAAIPLVTVKGMGGLKAIVGSVRLFWRRPFTFLGLAVSVLVGPILLGFMVSHPARIVDSFKPELIYWLLTASVAVEMIAYFLWMGTAVRFLSIDDH